MELRAALLHDLCIANLARVPNWAALARPNVKRDFSLASVGRSVNEREANPFVHPPAAAFARYGRGSNRAPETR